MRKIKANQLPNWFDLSKYSTASDLDLSGWAENLRWRSELLTCDPTILEQSRNQIAEYFHEAPSLIIETDTLKYEMWRKFSVFGSSESSLVTATVQPLDVLFVVDQIATASHEDSDQARLMAAEAEKWWSFMSSCDDDFEIDEDTRHFWDQPIDIVERAENHPSTDFSLHIEVNLAAPDKLILENFETWLKEARCMFSIGPRKLFSEAAMRGWARDRVLPYLDLTFWAVLEGTKITDSVMGSALFPDEYDINLPERIRKVVRRKAKWLVQSSVMQAMEKQIVFTD